MAVKLILTGRVQGVGCRYYCGAYGKALGIRGSATNLPDGTVRVLLDTEDQNLTGRYVQAIKTDIQGYGFYGRIDTVTAENYSGPIRGDYIF